MDTARLYPPLIPPFEIHRIGAGGWHDLMHDLTRTGSVHTRLCCSRVRKNGKPQVVRCGCQTATTGRDLTADTQDSSDGSVGSAVFYLTRWATNDEDEHYTYAVALP